MPYISYKDALAIVKEKLAEQKITPIQYDEDPVLVPGVERWNNSLSMLKVEQCGEKNDTIFAIQMYFNYTPRVKFGKYSCTTEQGCNVDNLKSIVVIISRPDFASEDDESLTLNAGGFAIKVHRRMPKSIATKLDVRQSFTAEDIEQWLTATLTTGEASLLQSAAMFSLMASVVDAETIENVLGDTNGQ